MFFIHSPFWATPLLSTFLFTHTQPDKNWRVLHLLWQAGIFFFLFSLYIKIAPSCLLYLNVKILVKYLDILLCKCRENIFIFIQRANKDKKTTNKSLHTMPASLQARGIAIGAKVEQKERVIFLYCKKKITPDRQSRYTYVCVCDSSCSVERTTLQLMSPK